MTKDEYKAIKKKGSDLRERLRKRLNVPELPAVSDENYDKIRSIYNSADKQVTKFLNNLESKEFFKTWYPIEYLSEKDVEDIAVIVISRMRNGTTDRKILDNIKKGICMVTTGFCCMVIEIVMIRYLLKILNY